MPAEVNKMHVAENQVAETARRGRCTFRLPSVLLLSAMANVALLRGQAPVALAPANRPSVQTASAAPKPAISYVGGMLEIDASDMTLAQVLMRVASLTGIKFDIPPEASSELMPVIRVGPGSSRQVLASLLRESHFNFLLQGSDADPDKLQSVLILPEDKKDNAADSSDPGTVPGRRSLGRPGGLQPKQEEASAYTPSVQTGSESQPPGNGAAPGSDGGAPPPQPDQNGGSVPVAVSPSSIASSDGMRPGAMSPPAVLSQENITQQLQQMYTQRMQMNQQGRPSGTAPTVTPDASN